MLRVDRARVPTTTFCLPSNQSIRTESARLLGSRSTREHKREWVTTKTIVVFLVKCYFDDIV